MLRAVIFDFDGVIADDEALHLEGLRRAFAPRGIRLDKDTYYERYLGFDDRGCVRQVLLDNKRAVTNDLIDALVEDKRRAFRDVIAAGVRIFPGAAECVRRTAARYPVAIGSGAIREEIELILGAAGLRRHFVAIACADDVAAGKPDPEVFNLALARLNALDDEAAIGAAECVVIEDSVAGVEGARRAGMRCLAVTNSAAPDALQAADLVVSSLVGLGPSTLERVCAR